MISCIRLLLVSLFIFSLVVAGCSAKPPDIQFSDIVVIPSPVMKGVVSVFMRIKNNGGKDNLTGVRTDIDGTIAELHDVRDGRMVKVKDIGIPSDGKVEMIPGGMHIMIFNLPDDFLSGKEMVLYMRFEKSGEKSVKLRVIKKD
jgi:copper(I)-binding protein